jgi:hypothetical protein
VPKGLPINNFGKLAGRKGGNLGLWMVAKALPGKHSQQVAFCLYLAILRKAHCRAELVSPAKYGWRMVKAPNLDLHATFSLFCTAKLPALRILRIFGPSTLKKGGF